LTKKAFINKYSYVPKQTYLDMEEYLKDFSIAVRHLIYHIINCTLREYDKEHTTWVPIPSTAINKELGQNVRVKNLEELGIISIKPLNDFGKTYSRFGHLCREYEVSDTIWEVFTNSLDANRHAKEFVNLFNGKPRKIITNSKATLGSRGVMPSSLVSKAVNSMEPFRFNAKSTTEHIEFMRAKADYTKTDKFRYIADLHAYNYIMSGSVWVNMTEAEYHSDYATQMSGRVSELGGGFQSCSRLMKHAAFFGIENINNYDLKSSQILGVMQLFEEAGISTEAIGNILQIDKAKTAAQLSLTLDSFKKVLIEIILGADLPVFEKAGKCKHNNSFYEDIMLGAIGDSTEVYKKVYQWLQPLKKDIDKWHNTLLDKALSDKNGRNYILNKCGINFYLGEYIDKKGKIVSKSELKRQLAAFYLQGQEACFIHHLTILSKKYGFTVISNQHDGLLTIGEIPSEAIEEASKLSGLKYAELEKKNFVEGKEFHPAPIIQEIKTPNIAETAIKPTVESKAKKRRRRKPPDVIPFEWTFEDIDLVALMEQAELEDRRKMLSG